MQQRRRIIEQDRVDVLVRKIDDRVEMRDHAEQLVAHLLHARADRAHHLRCGVLRGFDRARRDQVMYGFRLGKSHFIVQKRAARELSGLGLPHAVREKRIERRGQDRSRAMALNFRHILARVGMRCAEHDRVAGIEQMPVLVGKRTVNQLLRGCFRQRTAVFRRKDRADRTDRLRTRYTDDADRSARCGNSGNRIIHR